MLVGKSHTFFQFFSSVHCKCKYLLGPCVYLSRYWINLHILFSPTIDCCILRQDYHLKSYYLLRDCMKNFFIKLIHKCVKLWGKVWCCSTDFRSCNQEVLIKMQRIGFVSNKRDSPSLSITRQGLQNKHKNTFMRNKEELLKGSLAIQCWHNEVNFDHPSTTLLWSWIIWATVQN